MKSRATSKARNAGQSTARAARVTAPLSAARAAQSDGCSHGSWYYEGDAEVRKLGLQCNCAHTLNTFDKANRYITRLLPYEERFKTPEEREEYEALLRALMS